MPTYCDATFFCMTDVRPYSNAIYYDFNSKNLIVRNERVMTVKMS